MILSHQIRRAYCYPCRGEMRFTLKRDILYACPVGHPRQIGQPILTRELAAVAPRLWERVKTSAHCWIWEGRFRCEGKTPSLNIGGQDKQATKIVWAVTTGFWPDEGLWLIRRCHNVRCVKPEHLILIEPDDFGAVRKDRIRLFGKIKRRVCWRGHKLTAENRQKLGKIEVCRICRAVYMYDYNRGIRRRTPAAQLTEAA